MRLHFTIAIGLATIFYLIAPSASTPAEATYTQYYPCATIIGKDYNSSQESPPEAIINTGEGHEHSGPPCTAEAMERDSKQAQSDYEDYWRKSKCDANKEDGEVWVVFAKDCVTFTSFWSMLVQYLLLFSSLIAGAMFIFASYKYLTSRGDPSALADARDMIIQTTMGIILIASAYVIIQVLNAAFTLGEDAPIYLLPFFDIY